MRRLWLVLMLSPSAWLVGCSKPEARRPTEASRQPESLPAAADIRSVGFRNFDYPKIRGETDTEIYLRNGIDRNPFRDLNRNAEPGSPANGEAWLGQLLYGYDDAVQPIAVVVVHVNGGGTMTVSEIFLYKLAAGAPKLLWSFETGDRADGGLRTIYFERGNLVLELYQEGSEDPACCASHFARHFYGWKNGQLLESGDQEWIPLPRQRRYANAGPSR